jgi:hypothetical protein
MKKRNSKRITKLDDYELPAEYPLDRRKMKRNRFAGRVKLTHGGAREGAGRQARAGTYRTSHHYVLQVARPVPTANR